MSYDVAIFGSLRFPRGKYRAWGELIVDAKAYRSVSKTFPKRSNMEPVPVSALLEELPRLTGHGLFQLDDEGGRLHVRGLFTQAAFEDRCRQLATLFLLSAEVGAEGDICFLGQGVFVGFGVSVGNGQAMLMTLTEDQVQNASLDPDLDVISGYFHVAEPAAPVSVPPPSLPPSGLGARPDLLVVPRRDPKR